jgi:hypothetical protein
MTLTFKVKLDGRAWNRPARDIFDVELEPGLRAALALCVGEVAKLGVQRASNTGAFVQSIGDRIGHPAPGLWSGEVYSPLSIYPDVIEDGRRKGARMPPTQPIALWAVRKLGLSTGEAERIAWVIARGISRKGIAAKHVFRDGLAAAESGIQRIFDGVAERIAERLGT